MTTFFNPDLAHLGAIRMISLDQRDVLHTPPSPLSRTASGRIDTFLEKLFSLPAMS
jgi:hypothetical protein